MQIPTAIFCLFLSLIFLPSAGHEIDHIGFLIILN